MQKIALVTDSCCDLPVEMQEKHDIRILNFTITVNDTTYTEREDLTPTQYHEMLRELTTLPTTAHITLFRFMELYEELARDGYTDVVLVTIHAGASATHDAAKLAVSQFAEEHPDSGLTVHVVDSHGYSMAYGYAMCRADELRRQGATAADIVSFLDDAFARAEIVLVPYTLKYIRYSGRVSAAAALAGDFLGLRPIIRLNDGESSVCSKVRGDKQVLPALVKYLRERIVENGYYMVGTTDMENAHELAALCEQALGYPPLCCFYLGMAVSTNTGPDTIALVFEGEKRDR